MADKRELPPVVLVCDDQPGRFARLTRLAAEFDGGRCLREFEFVHTTCYPELKDWYSSHRSRFVALVVLPVEFSATRDESRLAAFPPGLTPAVGNRDLREIQGFVIYNLLRNTGLDRVTPVLFSSCTEGLANVRDFTEFAVCPGQAGCSFVPETPPGDDFFRVLLESISRQALRRLNEADRRYWREEHQMVAGRSQRMACLVHDLKRIGPTEETVLILGEPGAGKELAANALHRLSSRYSQKQPLPLPVNMGALQRDLVLDDLFGHTEEAFSGAVAARAGIFETANGSTVFLDEIGDVEHDLQVKLVRVIESRKVKRLGSSTETEVDVRILAATNRTIADLQARFRPDFYSRVVQQSIHVPSLCERWQDESPDVLEDDIGELFHYTAEMLNRNPRHKRPLEPDRTAIRFLAALVRQFIEGHNQLFDGNVRSLRSVMSRAYERAQYEAGTAVGMGHVAYVISSQPSPMRPPASAVSIVRTVGTINLTELEKLAIVEALKLARGNRTKTAELLGITRSSLFEKMKRHGIKP
ncbi:MAG: sigma 54-interacting transcriptional regulator [candidate division WOR-3 bacterium]